MAHFQEPRSPRALRSPPASPAKPAESPTSPTARKTAKRSLGETSPGGSRPPRPKRVNSYSELNFSSIVRVDSLGTMALPAFGEGGSASEDEHSKRRPARAPTAASVVRLRCEGRVGVEITRERSRQWCSELEVIPLGFTRREPQTMAFSTRGSSSEMGTVLYAAMMLSTMSCLRGGRGRAATRAGRELFSRRPRAV